MWEKTFLPFSFCLPSWRTRPPTGAASLAHAPLPTLRPALAGDASLAVRHSPRCAQPRPSSPPPPTRRSLRRNLPGTVRSASPLLARRSPHHDPPRPTRPLHMPQPSPAGVLPPTHRLASCLAGAPPPPLDPVLPTRSTLGTRRHCQAREGFALGSGVGQMRASRWAACRVALMEAVQSQAGAALGGR